MTLPRPQFNMQSLMVAIVVVALGLTLWDMVIRVERAMIEQAAIEQVPKARASSGGQSP